MSLSNKNALVIDRGLYVYLAQKLGESFGNVRYHRIESDPFPRSEKAEIGKGLVEIEPVDDFWSHLDWADIIVFFDCYDGNMQQNLRDMGHQVFGAGLSSKMELDKIFFLETINNLGLPVPKTYRVEGLKELEEYLKEVKGNKYLKCSHRGDFETKKYTGMKQFKNWMEQYLVSRIGTAGKNIEILVQDPIKAEIEIGYDGFRVDGPCTKNCLIGYEIKDTMLAGKIFEEPPPIIGNVVNKMDPIYKKLGYRGHYSSEFRITKSVIVYPIDECNRAPSPPAGILSEIYGKGYPQAVWDISEGKMPTFEAEKPYGVELILVSPFHEKYQLCVEFPKSNSRWVKLKNHCYRDGAYYIIPNGNQGGFGSAIGIGDSVKEAFQNAMDVAEDLLCEDMDLDKNAYEEAEEQIAAGKALGIPF